MENNHSILNAYLVVFFNNILKIEENSLNMICNELSLREMHTIEAIINSSKGNVGDIAQKLKVTVGTLSVALKTLETKGYITREKKGKDRRHVHVAVTERGIEVNRLHQEFHNKMVDEIISCLSAKELEILMLGLDKLNGHFNNLDKY